MFKNLSLKVHPSVDLYHLSKIACGLQAFSRRRRSEVTIQSSESFPFGPATCAIDVRSARFKRTFVFDLRDSAEHFCDGAIDFADVYFKRGFVQSEVDKFPKGVREKIVPFGLNYACSNPGLATWFLRRFGNPLLRGWTKAFLNSSGSVGARIEAIGEGGLKEELRNLKRFLQSPLIHEFEYRPQDKVESVILFQTRVWAPENITDEADAVNEPRAHLVRLLRKEFGTRFWGGLVPCPYARKRYPDLLATSSAKRSDYIAMSKKALIGICTRGLHYSNPFKLPEYIASSKVIVAEPLAHELSVPLVEGRHYRKFTTPEECLDQCVRLMSDHTAAQEMKEANYWYYLKEIEPFSHLSSCLARGLTHGMSEVGELISQKHDVAMNG
jgi:hypothetical protein